MDVIEEGVRVTSGPHSASASTSARDRHAKGQGLGALALVLERRKLVAARISQLIAQVCDNPTYQYTLLTHTLNTPC